MNHMGLFQGLIQLGIINVTISGIAGPLSRMSLDTHILTSSSKSGTNLLTQTLSKLEDFI